MQNPWQVIPLLHFLKNRPQDAQATIYLSILGCFKALNIFNKIIYDWPVVAFVVGFFLLEIAEEVVEPRVDDPDPVDVVQRRLCFFQKRLETKELIKTDENLSFMITLAQK